MKRFFKVITIVSGFMIYMFLGSIAQTAEIEKSPLTDNRGGHPTAFSLQECIDIGMKKNRFHVASRYSVEIAEAQHQQALSGYWPQINAKASYSIVDHDPNFIFPAENIAMPQGTALIVQVPNPKIPRATMQIPVSNLKVPEQNVTLMNRENGVASVNVTVPLYTGGQIGSVVRQAEQGVKAAEQEVRRTDLQIAYDVTRYYYGVVLARELAEIGKETLERMDVTLKVTENLYKNGSGKVKKTDYLRIKTVVEWMRTAVRSLEANEQLARAALTNAMGVSWENPIDPALHELPFNPATIALKELVNGAYSFNPDWASLEAGLDAASAKIDEAESNHMPKVGLFGNFTHIENSYDQGIVTTSNKSSWVVGIGMEMSIFNGLRTTNEVAEAKARLHKMTQQQFLLKEGIALQIQQIYIQWMSSQEQKASAEAASMAAGENRSLNERAYREGLVETKDVLEAQIVESLMKAQYRKTLYDNLEARAKLDFVVGKEIADIITPTL